MSSHSPSTTASTPSFRSVVRGVVDAWGPTATSVPATPARASTVSLGTRNSGGAQRQKR
jgi:hypothetical protein